MVKRYAVKRFDPLDIDGRLYRQVSELLDQLEDPHVTLRERTAALKAIASIRIAYVKLSDHQDDPDAGSSVRKYAAAFAKNAPSGRAKLPRPAAVGAPPELVAAAYDDEDD